MSSKKFFRATIFGFHALLTTPACGGSSSGDDLRFTTGEGDGMIPEGSTIGPESGTEGVGSEASDDMTEDTANTDTPPPPMFDLGGIPDINPDDLCMIPNHLPCDAGSENLAQALGLCENEVSGLNVQFTGYPDAILLLGKKFGHPLYSPYNIQEGARMIMLSTGHAPDMLLDGQTPSGVLLGYDPGENLPQPLDTNPVGNPYNCLLEPALVGTGDCSHSLWQPWSDGGNALIPTWAHDYGEIRVEVQVPPGVSSFSVKIAFFSAEYPSYYQSFFNDMYITWLEGERWTGNISFDEDGKALSLNSSFLDFKSADPDYCPDCTAQELWGTAMRHHAGTRWLEATGVVNPGETIVLLFSIFDMTDSSLDSAVLLDGFQWGCDDTVSTHVAE